MSLSKQDTPALILIDIQKGFDDIDYWGGHRNNPEAENNAAKLLKLWRKNSLPVFHVKHCSTSQQSRLVEGQPGNDFKEVVAPKGEEPIIKKNVNSAFIGTDLKQRLEQSNIKKLVIVGLTTDHCVSTTVRMAGNFGFDTYVVFDATATFDKKGLEGQVYSAELIHETALASLDGEFATVVKTGQLIKELSL
ncbi:MAG: cysteine hydrolase [Bacteroidales bacterium]|nr:cysteine hydrolase [Bacteroidales bacterium]